MRLIIWQLAGVWLAGTIVAAFASWLFVVAAFLGAPVLALPPVLLMFGLVYLAGLLTADASPLSASPVRRLLWAFLITVPGVLLGIAMPDVLDALHIGQLGLGSVLLLSLPFLLITGTLVANWPIRLAAIALLVALICIAIWLPSGSDSFTTFWHYTFRQH